ncbi:hypothetical protein [Litchfieldia alkalitelluris]|uniref:hypothetical protein n=1 Tax=Litchfieldia alkalitelluris TaxID=304268 RepID=UPI0011172956|nr:hypothetical protein [Litchfieldia alkalitelluris]
MFIFCFRVKPQDNSAINFEEFQYYFEDKESGEVFTNIDPANKVSAEQYLSENSFLLIEHFPSRNYQIVPYGPEGISMELKELEGFVTVPKNGSAFNGIIDKYDRFSETQKRFQLFLLSGMIALLVGLLILVMTIKLRLKWIDYLRTKLPLYINLLLIWIIGFFAYNYISGISRSYVADHVDIAIIVKECLLAILSSGVIFILSKTLINRLTYYQGLKHDITNTVIFKTISALREVFLIKSFGTQVLLFLIS